MHLPCFCLYYLKNSMFICPKEPGIQKLKTSIPYSYFRDFADNMSPEEVQKLPEDERPVLIVIEDYPEFKRRLVHKLIEIGLLDREIIETKVSYFDFDQYGEFGRPWQDWTLCSAHGTECDPVAAVMEGKSAFFLTGGALGPAALCARLSEAGLGHLPVTVGENLACAGERIVCGAAEKLQKESFAPLSVLLAEAAPCAPRRAPGWPDAVFVRGAVPMTKRLVRAAALAQLGVAERGVYWDVGAGTGSVSVELAAQCRRGTVYAVECRSEACALIRANREKFCAWNLRVAEGGAPETLAELPAPEGVFIGGSGVALEAIVAVALQKNKRARIVISAITLETVGQAMEALRKHGLMPEAAQLAVSETKAAGALHLLQANNPVFLIAGGGHG